MIGVITVPTASGPNKNIKDAVDKKVRAGECLQCKKPAAKRGLCSKHHAQFHRALKGIGDQTKAAEFEAKAIAKGIVLAKGYAAEKNDYAKLAAAVS